MRGLTDEEMGITSQSGGLTDEQMGITSQQSMINQAVNYPTKGYQGNLNTLGGLGKAGINLISPPGTNLITSPNNQDNLTQAANIPSQFEDKRRLLESAGQTLRQAGISATGNIVSNISELAAKHLPSYLAEPIQRVAGEGGGILSTLATVAPITPTEFGAQAAGEILPSVAANAIPKSWLESVANRWANAPKWMREGRWEKGQTNVGQDVLNLPKDKVGDIAINDKTKAANAAKLSIKYIGGKIDDEINNLVKKGLTPSQPDVPISGTPQLEYKPSQVTQLQQPRFSSDATIVPPITISEYVPEKQIAFYGQRTFPEKYTKLDILGTHTPQRELVTPTSPQTTYGGFEKTIPVGSLEPPTEVPPTRSGMGDAVRSLNEPERFSFTGTKQGPNVDIRPVKESLTPILEDLKTSFGEGSPQYQSMLKFRDNFFADKPDFMDIKSANKLRQTLGDTVGKNFSKEPGDIRDITDAQRIMYGEIRDQLGRASPQLDELLTLQHKLLDIKNSLKPEASLGYDKTSALDWIQHPVDTPINKLKTNVGLADTLNQTKSRLTENDLAVGGAIAGRGIGLSGYLKKRNQ